MSGTHHHGRQPGGPVRARVTLSTRTTLAPLAGATVADGVIELDTLLGGWERVTAGYLIEGDAPVLVETGSQSSVPVLLAQLERLGSEPTDLAGVVVTHIHLDHAGGVGDVARAFPKATVYVHPKGARHLVDPTRLVDSASRVYGPLLDSLYGRLDPTPAERIHVLEDGEAIAVSSEPVAHRRGLTRSRQAPRGPARHVERDPLRRRRRRGQAARRRGAAAVHAHRPTSISPRHSPRCERFAERRPTGLALAHYGLLADPLDVLRRGRRDAPEMGRRGRVGVPQRRGHRRRSGHRVRVRSRRRARGAPREARGDERGPLQRRRAPSLAVHPERRQGTGTEGSPPAS